MCSELQLRSGLCSVHDWEHRKVGVEGASWVFTGNHLPKQPLDPQFKPHIQLLDTLSETLKTPYNVPR